MRGLSPRSASQARRWHCGSVNSKLPADRQRTVTLSRYAKATRILSDAEAADLIAQQLRGTGATVPFNTVTPALRQELANRGVVISEPEKGNAGQAAMQAYEQWKETTASERGGDIKPVGHGPFGDIFDQFKGKVREAYNFLLKRKSGDALAVWHRNDVGDIDLVYGNREQNAGLDHIIDKHVG
ncbi:MAG: hypothetical protein IJT30_05010, partial [Muribaculaceae bacterium]|nr:hypothetical protein [Muribaculaceae bacterium]